MCEYNYVESEDSKKYREARGRLEKAIEMLKLELKNISQQYLVTFLFKNQNDTLKIPEKEAATRFLKFMSHFKIYFLEDDTFIIEFWKEKNNNALTKFGERLETNFKREDLTILEIFYAISYLPEFIIVDENGDVVTRKIGAMDKQALDDMISGVLNGDSVAE